MLKFLLSTFTFLLFIGYSALSQSNISIRGKLTDESGKALELVNISVKGTSNGAVSSANGNYTLSYSGKSPVTLSFSRISFIQKDTSIVFVAGKNIVLNISLSAKDEQIAEIKIIDKGAKEGGLIQLDAKILNSIPLVSGNQIQSFIKTLPGVASVNEMSSNYSVRGGNFDENLVYINNFEIFRPVLVQTGRQEGLDMANADLVSAIDFSSGGFAAKYGDKISSVLDIHYKKPTEFKGSASLGLLGASAHAEGTAAKGKLSYLSGIRYKNSQYLLNSLETKGEYKPNFFDAQTQIDYRFSDKFSIDLLAYFSNNNYLFYPEDQETSFGTIQEAVNLFVDFEGNEKDKFTSILGGLTFKYQLNPLLAMELKASAYVDYEELKYDIKGRYSLNQLDKQIDSDSFGDSILNLGIGSFLNHARNYFEANIYTLNYKASYVLANQFVQWGVKYQNEEVQDKITEWQLIDSAGYSIPYNGESIELASSLHSENKLSSNRYSAFLQSVYKSNSGIEWNIEYGLRFQYWDVNKNVLLSPRVAGGFYPSLNKKLYLRVSSGVYYQSLFYKEIIDRNGVLYENLNSPRSIHFTGSADYDFSMFDRPFHLKGEFYYKIIDDIIPYSIDNIRVHYYPDKVANGYITGLDFRLNGEFVPGVESWLSVSLMKSEMQIENDTIGKQPFPNDHPINISLFFQDYVPGNDRFRVNLALVYIGGLPFGPPMDDTYYAPLRMPSYKRVDIGFTVALKQEGKKSKSNFFNTFRYINIGLDVFNLLGINNIISYNWITVVPNSSSVETTVNDQYAVPNHLSARRFNLRLTVGF